MTAPRTMTSHDILPLPPLAAIDWQTVLVQPLIATFAVGLMGIFLLFASMLLLDRLTPYSVHKQLSEKGNVAVAILFGSVVIGLSIIIAAVAKG